jgi:Fic family protein
LRTLEILRDGVRSVPTATAWYLEALGEARGRQQLYTAQSPQKLKALREHALVESAVSSNRIEGVSVERERVGTVVFGEAAVRDRDEEEVRGYRRALDWIHGDAAGIPIDEAAIRRLHALARGEIWDAGKYKERDGDIVERAADGRSRVRFRTVPAADTPNAMAELVDLWTRCGEEGWAPPLVAAAACNLDFLCVHPFRDGNGRVSRLLLLVQCYQAGLEVGRYVSLERLIEQSKERYYETLEESSRGWHDGKHDPWPYVNYLLATLKEAYREFEARLGNTAAPRGAKTEAVKRAIAERDGSFSVAELRALCPGVSLDTIRAALKDLRSRNEVACLGKGPAARWAKVNG